MTVIDAIRMEATSDCQLNCQHCSHGDAIRRYPGWHLDLQDLRFFLSVSKESGYTFDILEIHGFGDPFLWKHLREGVEVIRNSGVVNRFEIVTNGLMLGDLSLAEHVLYHIDHMRISVYPHIADKVQGYIDRLSKWDNKIEIVDRETFYRVPIAGEFFGLPGSCGCHKMFFKDRVFICGPSGWEALRLLSEEGIKVDVRDFEEETSVPVKLGWYDEFQMKFNKHINRMLICTKCATNWNKNADSLKVTHSP